MMATCLASVRTACRVLLCSATLAVLLAGCAGIERAQGGDIASLAGIQDDPRHFQISVPVQPGNSGGALVDGAGNVVGVVSAKLSARAALAATGSLPENVNYAVKSSFLLSFLESVPELAGKLPDLHSGERRFEDVVKDAQQASVLVLVY